MRRFKVADDDTGKRFDVFVAERMPQISRSQIEKHIEAGEITVNKNSAKSSYKLKAKDTVAVNLGTEPTVANVDLPIIYEDDDCIVIDKPAGVLTHSKGAFNPEGTVATFIGNKISGMEGERAGIVHRLDRATSGVIIAAKNAQAQAWLQKQFSQRKVKKIYAAVIEGAIKPESAIIDMPIERNPKKPQTFRVGANGKPARTKYATIHTGHAHSLLQLEPETGRTHQLRVHLKHQGHPIVGDALYGGKLADRLYLHALALEITVPSRERKTFESKLPKQFKILAAK